MLTRMLTRYYGLFLMSGFILCFVSALAEGVIKTSAGIGGAVLISLVLIKVFFTPPAD